MYERFGLDLVLAVLVRAHRGDMQAGMQPSGLEDRFGRWRGGYDELAFGHDALRIVIDAGVDAKIARQVGRASLRLLDVAAPYQSPAEGTDQMSGLDLEPGLNAGAEHASGFDRRRRQMPGGDGSRRRRADVGQIAIVEKQGLDESRRRGKQDHQAVEARKAEPRIVEEAGADLDGEAIEAGNIGGFHVDLAMGLGDRHGQDRRHDDFARRQRREGVLDDLQRVEVERDAASQVGLGQDGDVMRHRRCLSARGRRARRRGRSRCR